MNWLLPNLLIAIPFFLAWTLIPLWMVLKHPDARPTTKTSSAQRPPKPATAAHQPHRRRRQALASHH